jgi:signal transduction histidine kinase
MAQIPFNVSARTARLIGRENVANAEGAIIELIKNCYDADSSISILIIDKPADEILIIDAGDGMTDEIIRNEWMTIGTDNKLNNAITATGRIKAGAKGIGRFALDRLGDYCEMITVPIYNSDGHKWVVDWSTFEGTNGQRNVSINEVYADLSTIPNVNFRNEIKQYIRNDRAFELIAQTSFKHGTLLRIKNLRDEWKGISIDRLYKNLSSLTPPDGSNKMALYLFEGSNTTNYGLIENEDYRDYDYKITAKYVTNSNFNVSINVHRNEFDFNQIDERLFGYEDMQSFPFDKNTFKKEHFNLNATFKDLIKGLDYENNIIQNIGDFEFTLYWLKNQTTAEDKLKYKFKDFLGDRQSWLKRFGGIKLYRDNFRVRPYGEPNTQAYDWLLLGERQAQNPAGVSRKGGFRVRPNQVAGIVKISRLSNLDLEDKSSREGLQENASFDLFRNLLLGVIKIQEDDRSTIASNLNELYSAINEEAQAAEDSTKIADEDINSDKEEDKPTRKKYNTLQKGIQAKDKQLKLKDEELAISRAMASAGIMIASFSHEFHKIKNKLNSRTYNLRNYLSEVIDDDKLKAISEKKNPYKLIDDIEKQDEKLKQWIEFSIGLTRKDRRKNKNINVIDYFKQFSDLWNNMLNERNIAFKLNYDEASESLLRVRMSELDLDTIFDNLLTNSVEAFQRKDFSGEKKISIGVSMDSKSLLLTYRDTGPGIPEEFKNVNDVFKPFETSKRDDAGNEIGTGLGMWLLKAVVDYNKGKVLILRTNNGFRIDFQFKLS